MTRSSGPEPEAAARAQTIDVTFVGHATTLVSVDGTRVLTDPFLRSRLGPLQRHGPLPDARGLEADVVVISHGHPDHFDTPSLERLPGRPVVVVPRGLGTRVRPSERGAREVVEIAAGESLEVGGVTIEAVPARHWVSPGAPRAQPLGYVFDAGARVYFAGDTGRFPAMTEIAAGVDLALLPIWTWGPHLGPGHLGPRAAAEVAGDLAAATVIPIHWGTLYPRGLHRVWGRALADPGARFADFARRLAPGVDVRVMQPGAQTSVVPVRGRTG
jgi:L-ascorbate metabolism protein UlaG (beta-lactamase superfamily)